MTARVLHVLPHAGAGAETYIEVLSGLDGFSFGVLELAASRSGFGALESIARRQSALARAARAVDVVHVHGEIAGIIALPWLIARPSVVTLHGLHLMRRLTPGPPARLARGNLLVIISAAGRTICVSQAERDELDWLPERARRKLAVVLNGIALPPPPAVEERTAVRRELGLADDQIAVLYAGQMEERKDPSTLVRAVKTARAQNPSIVLLMVGEGPLMPQLRSLADEGVRFLGQRHDVRDLMRGADIFVMPSLREGLSYAVLEALSYGVATIVSDGPGNPEAVARAGLVFPAGDDGRLATMIIELAPNAERRAALGAAGRERVGTDLSAGQMRRATRKVYESVLKAPDRAGDAPSA